MKDIRAGYQFESATYHYKLEDLMGDGGYGRVYEARATKKPRQEGQQEVKEVALKIEPRSTSTAIEAQVLKMAQERGCRRIPRIFDSVSSLKIVHVI